MASQLEESAAVPGASPCVFPQSTVGEEQNHFPRDWGIMQMLDSAVVIVELFLYEPGAPCVEIQLFGDGDLLAVVLLHPVRGVDKIEF